MAKSFHERHLYTTQSIYSQINVIHSNQREKYEDETEQVLTRIARSIITNKDSVFFQSET
jgi:hypothetical protein